MRELDIWKTATWFVCTQMNFHAYLVTNLVVYLKHDYLKHDKYNGVFSLLYYIL